MIGYTNKNTHTIKEYTTTSFYKKRIQREEENEASANGGINDFNASTREKRRYTSNHAGTMYDLRVTGLPVKSRNVRNWQALPMALISVSEDI